MTKGKGNQKEGSQTSKADASGALDTQDPIPPIPVPEQATPKSPEMTYLIGMFQDLQREFQGVKNKLESLDSTNQKMEENRVSDLQQTRREFDEKTRRLAQEFSRERPRSEEQSLLAGHFGREEEEEAGGGGPQVQETPVNARQRMPTASMTFASSSDIGSNMSGLLSSASKTQGSSFKGDENAPYVVTAQDISPRDKLQKTSLSGVKWMLMDQYPQYKVNCVGLPKKLIHFMSLQVKNDMLLEQRRRGTPWSMIHNVDSMMEALDEQVTQFLAQCLMPPSYTKYREELWRFMTKLGDRDKNERAGEKQAERQLSVEVYTPKFHSTVERMLNELEMYDNFFRINCENEDERSYLPKLKFGRNSDPQAFNFFLEAFAPYSASFKSLLSESAITDCKSLGEFIRLFRTKSNELSAKNKEYQRSNERMKSKEKEADFLTRMAQEDAQKKFRDGAAERQLHGNVDGARRDNRVREEHSRDQFRSERRPDNPPPERSRAHFRAMESSEDADDHCADEQDSYDLAVAAAVGRGKRETDDLEAMSAETQQEPRRVFYQNGPSLPTSRSGMTPTNQSSRNKPCFNKLKTNTCSAGSNCPFSHD
jgi:hypothetical protein